MMRSRRSAGPRALSLAGLLAVVATLTLSLWSTQKSLAQDLDPETTTTPPASLGLIEENPWVEPAGTFSARLVVDEPVAASAVVRTILHDRVPSRSDFAASLDGSMPRELLRTVTRLPNNGGADRTEFVVNLPLTTGRDDTRYTITEAGVYPLLIEVVENGPPPDRPPGVSTTPLADATSSDALDEPERVTHRVITHMVRVPGPNDRNRAEGRSIPLSVSVVADLHESWQLEDGGQVTPGPGERAATREVAEVLAELPGTPVSLRPTPALLDQLANSSSDGDQQLLANLRGAASNREVLATPYVRLDAAAWLEAGLEDELADRLTLGTDTLTEVLEVRPDRRIVIHDGRIPSSLLDDFRTLGVDAFVVDEVHLDSLDAERFPITLLQKFQLAEPQRGASVALAADSALSAHLQLDDPTLAAHRVLADLAVLYFDLPGIERGAVVKPAADGAFRGQALRTLLLGLRGNPILRATTLDRQFDRVPLARQGSFETEGQVLQRRLRPNPVSALGDYSKSLQAAEAQLAAYRAMVGPESVRPEPWARAIELSAAQELTTDQRSSVLDEVIDEIRAQTRGIDVPTAENVTLTNREGEIPLRLRNSLGYPVRVRVVVESDKLDIDGADLARVVTLEEGSNRIPLLVSARASGDSRLMVKVTSPDGRLALGEGRYTIRSTSVSGFGIALSVGAGLVLAVWWLRHHRDRRRDKRLVAAATAV